MTFHDIGTANALARSGRRCLASTNSVGGAYGWLTPYLAIMAANNGDLAADLLTLPRKELHFVAMTLSLMGMGRNDADHLAAFARGLYTVSRRTLIEDACLLGKIEPAPGLAKLPAQLSGRVWRPASYRRLAALMHEPSARNALRRLPRITRGRVIMLARLPDAYRTHAVMDMIKRRRDLAEVVFAIELVRRVRVDLDDARILASLEGGRVKKDGVHRWVMKHYERAPFPAAPTEGLIRDGVEVLRPLTCYADLARAAREFDNCIRTYLWAVLKGDAYFYRYAPEAGGKGAAIVELRRAPVVGWLVHEALGPNNNPISGLDRAAIIALFREAGVEPAPQAVSPNAWFDLS
jgi:hypothetical protein